MPSSVERLISLNLQAIAILRLSIPLELGLGFNPIDRLQEINERLMNHVGDSTSLDLQLERLDVPDRYRSIAAMLVESDDPAQILEAVSIEKTRRRITINPFYQAVAQPIVISVLVYLGLVLLCLFTAPKLQAEYDQLQQVPHGVSAVLLSIKQWMPVWLIAYPIALVLLVVLWTRLASRSLLNLVPGVTAYQRALDSESQMQSLAALTHSGVKSDRAMKLTLQAGPVGRSIRPIADEIVRSSESPSRAPALMRLGRFYRFLAKEQQRSRFAKLPAYASLACAGLFVLAYGLATFVPWVEVLRNLGKIGGA